MNERTQNMGFGLSWVIGVIALLYATPHTQIGPKIAKALLGQSPTTSHWVGYLVLNALLIAGLWFGASRFHVNVRDNSDSFIEPGFQGLVDRISIGLVWAIATSASITLLLGICSTGGHGTFRAFVYGAARGDFESSILLVFGGFTLLIVGMLMMNRTIWTLFSKEFRIYFTTPIAYAVMMLFTFLTGFFFNNLFTTFDRYQNIYRLRFRMSPAQFNLNDFVFTHTFRTFGVILLFLVPILTMRLFAEEKKNKTYELLMTAPITTFEIVTAKYLSSFAVLSVMMGLTFIYPLLVGTMHPGTFEWAPVLSGYLGLLLLVGAFAGIGMFCSSLTENQIIAAAIAFGVLLGLWVVEWAASFMSPGKGQEVVQYLSLISHLKGFTKGVVSYQDVIYYMSVIFFCNFLAHRAVETQRWR